jgi:hypothetical protein
VQPCGEAHLSNVGVYASPERSLVFDLNDLDETLRGPFEGDELHRAAVADGRIAAPGPTSDREPGQRYPFPRSQRMAKKPGRGGR